MDIDCNALKYIVPKELAGMTAAKGKIVVELLDLDEKSKGGLIFHSFSKPVYTKAIVCLLGPATKKPYNVSLGQIVLVDKALGKECQINGKTFYIFENDGVFAVIGHGDGEGANEIYGNRHVR